MKTVARLFLTAMAFQISFTNSVNANGQPPPNRVETLRRGANINRWFSDPGAHPISFYASYVSLQVLKQIKSAGFTYVRVPLSPSALQQPDGELDVDVAKALVVQMAAIQNAGLGVSISPERQKWDLSNNPRDRASLAKFWDQLAPLLAPLNPNLTFVETLNEPNFPNGSDWDALQLRLLRIIRSHLPNVTILATGNHWDDVTTLPKTKLLPDRNIVYVFHFYDPTFLTSTQVKDLPAEDAPVLSALIFPVNDPSGCTSVSQTAKTAKTEGQVKWYCQSGWTAAKVAADIHAAAAWAHQNGVVVANEEFGILDNRPKATRLAYLLAVRKACEAEGMGWGLWAYNDGFGLGATLGKSGPATLDPSLLMALGLTVTSH